MGTPVLRLGTRAMLRGQSARERARGICFTRDIRSTRDGRRIRSRGQAMSTEVCANLDSTLRQRALGATRSQMREEKERRAHYSPADAGHVVCGMFVFQSNVSPSDSIYLPKSSDKNAQQSRTRAALERSQQRTPHRLAVLRVI